MAGRKRRGWNKYIADYDKLRMFLRYISYGCYHKQYLARQLGQSARSYEDNWARVRSFLPEDRLQAVRQGHREIHSLKGDSYHSAFNDLARTYAIKSLKSSTAFALLCLLQIFSSKAAPEAGRGHQPQHAAPISLRPDGAGTLGAPRGERSLWLPACA